MSTASKPEKILGKKFVRGKPYYKIKWEGSAKDQSSWQSPASLKQFKSMINKYEIKNWGAPLDDKFFDAELYITKGFASKKTIHDKKKAIQKKKSEKKKIQEPEQSASQQNNPSQQQDGQQQNVMIKMEEKSCCKSFDEPIEPRKIKLSANNNSSKQELQIIDLDQKIISQKEKEKPKILIEAGMKQSKPILEIQVTQVKAMENVERISINDANIIKIDELQKQDKQPIKSIVPDASDCEIVYPIQKDLGLILPPKDLIQPMNPEGSPNIKKVQRNLRCTSAVSLGIDPIKQIHQIVHIYHLEKMNMGNHLYLVEFQNKQMRKLTTDQMLQNHPDQLVSFLEHRFRTKCII